MRVAPRVFFSCFTLSLVMLVGSVAGLGVVSQAQAIGPVMTPIPNSSFKARMVVRSGHGVSAHKHPIYRKKLHKVAKAKAPAPVQAIQPQAFIDRLSTRELAPGVLYKSYRGALNINLVDVDTAHAPVKVRPVLAGDSFNQLAGVEHHARRARALAAVNANYFKKDGTPLGTLIVDGEWVAGPIYNRVSLGINSAGYVRIDRVDLFGRMVSSNPNVPSAWVNNINQPRRKGAHLIVYTRRWGNYVQMAYDGSLVAVNNRGEVVGKGVRSLTIPLGGYVLTDTKSGDIAKLKLGDYVHISWKTTPNDWQDVVYAVSGGPTLIKNGQIYLDVADERFRGNWTGAGIRARTAVGVTNDNHLLLLTVEGPHTLWDVAKFLQQMGAVEAMNLDGGGSTTMVVNGATVTRNATSSQRHVASSLAVMFSEAPRLSGGYTGYTYSPTSDLTDFRSPLFKDPTQKWTAAAQQMSNNELPVVASGRVIENTDYNGIAVP